MTLPYVSQNMIFVTLILWIILLDNRTKEIKEFLKLQKHFKIQIRAMILQLFG